MTIPAVHASVTIACNFFPDDTPKTIRERRSRRDKLFLALLKLLYAR
jgi:hypothetical protein